jgi:hypothetical protein
MSNKVQRLALASKSDGYQNSFAIVISENPVNKLSRTLDMKTFKESKCKSSLK